MGKIHIKYYLLRWIVCWLAIIDHLIGIFTFGTYCTHMASNLSIRHFTKQLNKDNKDQLIIKWPNLPWQPGWWYCKEGDCIFIRWDNESYRAKWLNSDITIHISDKAQKPTGVAIYGVKEEIYDKQNT